MEIYKTCLFNDKYLIGDNGTLKSLIRQNSNRFKDDIVKGLTKPDGYKMYWIKDKWHYSHRLVAIHFIPNPDNLSDVNHKDGNKSNNSINNLEWMSHKDNIIHSYKVLNRNTPKGRDHWNYGKAVKQSSIKLMSDAKTGNKHPRFKGYYIFNGNKYSSLASIPRGWKITVKKAKYYCMNNLNGYSFLAVSV